MAPPKRPQSLRPAPRASPLAGPGQTRSALPAEIIAQIIDYLPVSDLLRFARVSRRVQEMVYDDTRWVHRLHLMGLWNEQEARARFDAALKKRRAAEAQQRAADDKAAAAAGRPALTLFDASVEEEKRKAAALAARRSPGGLDMLALEPERRRIEDKDALLTVLKGVRSIRGYARQEFGRIYGALAPLYLDLVRARSHADPVLFRMYDDPEQQAAMLAQLRTVARADTAFGWRGRLERLESMMDIFENAALREFEAGYEAADIDGRLRKYAHVLITLNGGTACVQLFIQKHPVLYEALGNPMDCFDHPPGAFSLEPSKVFLTRLAEVLNEQAGVIDRAFPPTANVMLPFLERVAEDVVSEYVTQLLDEAHERDVEQYLKAVTGLYQQCMQFGQSLQSTQGAGDSFRADVDAVITHVFESHVDIYLQDELDHSREKCEAEVESWEKKMLDADAATESFLMSNVNREADKRDFLSSFKKVILMPVSIIPSPFAAGAKPATTTATGGDKGNRASVLSVDTLASTQSQEKLPADRPTTELAAKAALMNSRLEGIRSLFSLEIALNLVHIAKASLERAATFSRVPGQTGEEAREACETVFIAMLQVLGPRHVKAGFDKAVSHLSTYDPRSITSRSGDNSGVAPLVTFLELVNVGDLIQQMVDVFYNTELVAAGLTDASDFLNPAVKEKKRFEGMLDERVAAGLNRGIDVLIDEVEHLFATTQQVTDFNPGALAEGDPATAAATATAVPAPVSVDVDVTPTPTALAIVRVVAAHLSLLTGSTEKSVLDVFQTEVGLRLFGAICKHIKRSRISTAGATRLIADANHYYAFVEGLRLKQLLPYFAALRELASTIYLIDGKADAKALAQVIAESSRFGGVWSAEEVAEFAGRREDWYRIKREVERAMYGFGCVVV